MPQFLGTPIDDLFFRNATDAAVDITSPDLVEVLADPARGIVWVNVNGVCVLRCCRIKQLELGDTVIFKEREYPT